MFHDSLISEASPEIGGGGSEVYLERWKKCEVQKVNEREKRRIEEGC